MKMDIEDSASLWLWVQSAIPNYPPLPSFAYFVLIYQSCRIVKCIS